MSSDSAATEATIDRIMAAYGHVCTLAGLVNEHGKQDGSVQVPLYMAQSLRGWMGCVAAYCAYPADDQGDAASAAFLKLMRASQDMCKLTFGQPVPAWM